MLLLTLDCQEESQRNESRRNFQIGKSTEEIHDETEKTRCSAQTIDCTQWEHPNVQKTYYVYIMASQRRVLYVGITSHIEIRVRQHKEHTFEGFTSKYNVTNLVYFERYGSVGKAIRKEKELKGWRREKKIELIETGNPKWRDLSYGWYQVVLSK